MDALERLDVLGYMFKTVVSYVTNRILKHDTKDGPKEFKVTKEVPPGAVLGALLWNISNDGVLKFPRRVTSGIRRRYCVGDYCDSPGGNWPSLQGRLFGIPWITRVSRTKVSRSQDLLQGNK